MRYLLLLLALTALTALGGCDREPQAQAATPAEAFVQTNIEKGRAPTSPWRTSTARATT